MKYHADFIPSCSPSWSKPLIPVQAVTLGAGVQWVDVYILAEAHNITVVGGILILFDFCSLSNSLSRRRQNSGHYRRMAAGK